jgi:molecular chaperone GrpE
MGDIESVGRESHEQENDSRGATPITSSAGADRQEQTSAPAESEQSPPAETAAPQGELEALRAELEQARARAAEYLDGWQRARAEFANYKRRVEAEREELRRSSNQALLLKLLPVVDDFERAFQTFPPELKDMPWIDGMRMIQRKLHGILEGENVTPIAAAGQPFDPLWHEAVMQEETTQYPDDTVMEELQRGYMLGERVLRPARVKVASNRVQGGNQNG